MSSVTLRTHRIARRTLVATAVVALLAVASPAVAATSYTFRGRGWGHGLGLSQWGARGLAAKGKTASSILRHYYSGTTVESKPLPSYIRVGLLQERAEIWVEGDGRFDLHDRTGARRASGDAGQRWRVVPDGDRLKVYRPGSSSAVFSSTVPVTVRWEQYGTLLKLPQTGYTYKRGRIDVDINPSTGKTRAILIVPFEGYLYGLGEMPSSWHTEALEAQAIAGRTYALEKVLRLGQQRPVCNCAVYASTADQAYVGRQHEVQRWTDAVKSTAGLVVTYADKPIQALYSSSSGGFTEHNEYVFGGSALPYLRGKCDAGDYYGGDNPHNNWTVKMTDDQLSKEMSDAGRSVGTVVDIDVLSRGVSGRWTPMIDSDSGGVRVEGTRGTERMSGGTFRSILGLKSSLVHYHIYGSVRTRYDALGCRPGLPKSNEFTWRDLDGDVRGRAQNFVRGRLFFNASTVRVFWTMGAILKHYDYRRAKGHDLGLPTTDEISVPGGRASYFERGRIYWSSGTGAHEVHGAILSRYVNDLGGPGGKLGLPTSDEYSISGGRRSDFQHGYITWNSSTKKTSYKITS